MIFSKKIKASRVVGSIVEFWQQREVDIGNLLEPLSVDDRLYRKQLHYFVHLTLSLSIGRSELEQSLKNRLIKAARIRFLTHGRLDGLAINSSKEEFVRVASSSLSELESTFHGYMMTLDKMDEKDKFDQRKFNSTLIAHFIDLSKIDKNPLDAQFAILTIELMNVLQEMIDDCTKYINDKNSTKEIIDDLEF